MALYHPVLSLTGQPKYYIYPNGVMASTNWTRQDGGATNQHWAIDEVTPDDADYIRSEISPIDSEIQIAVTSPSIAAMDTSQPVRLRYRYAQTAGEDQILRMQLWDAGANSILREQVHYDADTSFKDGEFILSQAEAQSVANMDNLYVKCVASNGLIIKEVTKGVFAYTTSYPIYIPPNDKEDSVYVFAHTSSATTLSIPNFDVVWSSTYPTGYSYWMFKWNGNGNKPHNSEITITADVLNSISAASVIIKGKTSVSHLTVEDDDNFAFSHTSPSVNVLPNSIVFITEP